MNMTKKQCLAFEKVATEILREAFGEPIGDYTENSPYWEWNYRPGVQSRVILFCDSFEVGNTFRESWLACRVSSESFLDADRYTLPRSDIPGGWPVGATYPSGKNNLHGSEVDLDDPHAMRRQILFHLRQMTGPDTPAREALDKIEFEVA